MSYLFQVLSLLLGIKSFLLLLFCFVCLRCYFFKFWKQVINIHKVPISRSPAFLNDAVWGCTRLLLRRRWSAAENGVSYRPGLSYGQAISLPSSASEPAGHQHALSSKMTLDLWVLSSLYTSHIKTILSWVRCSLEAEASRSL